MPEPFCNPKPTSGAARVFGAARSSRCLDEGGRDIGAAGAPRMRRLETSPRFWVNDRSARKGRILPPGGECGDFLAELLHAQDFARALRVIAGQIGHPSGEVLVAQHAQ